MTTTERYLTMPAPTMLYRLAQEDGLVVNSDLPNESFMRPASWTPAPWWLACVLAALCVAAGYCLR
jgi:hypothetical protein